MTKRNILIILVFLLFFTGINAQTYKFEILSKGKKIGTITGTIKTIDKVIKVDIVALAKIHFIIDEDIKYELNSVYKDGMLFFSSASIFLNNKPHFSSVIRKDGENYILTKNGKQTTLNEPIYYSGSLLYFIEPIDKQKIFSEIDDILKDITKDSTSFYKIVNPKNGYASYFIFENGILKSAKIHHTYMDVEVHLLGESNDG